MTPPHPKWRGTGPGRMHWRPAQSLRRVRDLASADALLSWNRTSGQGLGSLRRGLESLGPSNPVTRPAPAACLRRPRHVFRRDPGFLWRSLGRKRGRWAATRQAQSRPLVFSEHVTRAGSGLQQAATATRLCMEWNACPKRVDYLVIRGAGDGNRTRMTSLEGWSSTIELHPRDDTTGTAIT
jgi:hypothetical protein